MKIKRVIQNELLDCAAEYPVVTVLGPRQSGKTTLVRMAFPEKEYRLLEDPDVRRLAVEDPRGFFADCPDGAILDEVQRVPELLSYIQGIVDADDTPGQFILTGSHQPELHQAISQTLAGRTALLRLLPLSFQELLHFNKQWDPFHLCCVGSFPRLHHRRLKPDRFYAGYMQTYIERDVRSLLNLKDLGRFQVFLRLLAGRTSQLVNYSALSNDVGVSATTIKSWIEVLKASFIVYDLQPYYENIRKRVTKSSKIYFTDTGMVCYLLGIKSADQLKRDPLRGGIYENLIITEVLKHSLNRGISHDLFFYRDSHGSEVDLLVRKAGKLYPVEIKSADTFIPAFIKGIQNFRNAAGDKSSDGTVIYNGEKEHSYKGNHILNPFCHGGFDLFGS
ncbi:AAA family ATPase [Candidatus Fermentibacteria bacterium]|nr:MAG: AAA family ATPase [Candidatus Fermentibacteria bacterium]